ncbi:MAG: hypothetical protein ACHQK9_04425 [Reyranellales bacterium]
MQNYGIAALLGSVLLVPMSGAMGQTDVASAPNPRPEYYVVFLDKGSDQLSSAAVDIVRSVATAAKSTREVRLVGRADRVNAVRTELVRQGVPVESIMERREIGQPLPKVGDGIAEPIDRRVEIKF